MDFKTEYQSSSPARVHSCRISQHPDPPLNLTTLTHPFMLIHRSFFNICSSFVSHKVYDPVLPPPEEKPNFNLAGWKWLRCPARRWKALEPRSLCNALASFFMLIHLCTSELANVWRETLGDYYDHWLISWAGSNSAMLTAAHWRGCWGRSTEATWPLKCSYQISTGFQSGELMGSG